jgi:hypothetical protein
METTMPVDRPSSFIGDFKLADNVANSLDVVRTLRTLREEANPARKRYLQKPMIILNVAIIAFTREPFDPLVEVVEQSLAMGMPANIITYIRGKQIDKLETLIASIAGSMTCSMNPDRPSTTTLTFSADSDRVHLQKREERSGTGRRQRVFGRTARALRAGGGIRHDDARSQASASCNTYTQPFHLPWPTYFP